MKSKNYLVSMCLLLLCPTSLHAEFSCPPPGKTTVDTLQSQGWVIDPAHKATTPEDYLKRFENTKFKGAWIFDPGKGVSRCNYNGVQLVRTTGDITTETYEFDPPADRDRKDKGLHCKQQQPEACKFVLKKAEVK